MKKARLRIRSIVLHNIDHRYWDRLGKDVNTKLKHKIWDRLGYMFDQSDSTFDMDSIIDNIRRKS